MWSCRTEVDAASEGESILRRNGETCGAGLQDDQSQLRGKSNVRPGSSRRYRLAFCGSEDVGVELLLSLEVLLVRLVGDAHAHVKVRAKPTRLDRFRARGRLTHTASANFRPKARKGAHRSEHRADFAQVLFRLDELTRVEAHLGPDHERTSTQSDRAEVLREAERLIRVVFGRLWCAADRVQRRHSKNRAGEALGASKGQRDSRSARVILLTSARSHARPVLGHWTRAGCWRFGCEVGKSGRGALGSTAAEVTNVSSDARLGDGVWLVVGATASREMLLSARCQSRYACIAGWSDRVRSPCEECRSLGESYCDGEDVRTFRCSIVEQTVEADAVRWSRSVRSTIRSVVESPFSSTL